MLDLIIFWYIVWKHDPQYKLAACPEDQPKLAAFVEWPQSWETVKLGLSPHLKLRRTSVFSQKLLQSLVHNHPCLLRDIVLVLIENLTWTFVFVKGSRWCLSSSLAIGTPLVIVEISTWKPQLGESVLHSFQPISTFVSVDISWVCVRWYFCSWVQHLWLRSWKLKLSGCVFMWKAQPLFHTFYQPQFPIVSKYHWPMQ